MQELRYYFLLEIAECRDGKWTTNIFPDEPFEEYAGTWCKVLIGSPAVYLFMFRQTAEMKRNHWLRNTIEESGYGL